MKRILITMCLCALLAACEAQPTTMTLSSQSMPAASTLTAKQIYKGFGCDGENLSPDLAWSRAPAGTKSFAITMYDPDAPTGSGWWHWLAYNIPPHVTAFTEGVSGNKAALKKIVEHRNDYGSIGFGGACPPEGDAPHRYIATVWALDVEKLPVDQKASAAMVGYFLNHHKIASATLEATYGREKKADK
jgi:Raf kinase inhibitor-like YbhB/YbcL family protein